MSSRAEFESALKDQSALQAMEEANRVSWSGQPRVKAAEFRDSVEHVRDTTLESLRKLASEAGDALLTYKLFRAIGPVMDRIPSHRKAIQTTADDLSRLGGGACQNQASLKGRLDRSARVPSSVLNENWSGAKQARAALQTFSEACRQALEAFRPIHGVSGVSPAMEALEADLAILGKMVEILGEDDRAANRYAIDLKRSQGPSWGP